MSRKSTPQVEPSPAALEAERDRLEHELAELHAVQQRFVEGYLAVEDQNSTLATLYVACQRLHSSLDRAEVLLAVREIMMNLIGCEEYALFSTVPGGLLRCVDSYGMHPDECEKVCLSTEVLWRVLQIGQPYLSSPGDAARRSGVEARISACIPLKMDGTVTGAIALFRLLPQKLGLQKLDQELFQLLENHLALALHSAELHATWTRKDGVVA
jgi:transcriptional regulator with GAF, ATPase, and Fis domain